MRDASDAADAGLGSDRGDALCRHAQAVIAYSRRLAGDVARLAGAIAVKEDALAVALIVGRRYAPSAASSCGPLRGGRGSSLRVSVVSRCVGSRCTKATGALHSWRRCPGASSGSAPERADWPV